MGFVRTWKDGRVVKVDTNLAFLDEFYQKNIQRHQPTYDDHGEGLGLWGLKNEYNPGEIAATILATNFNNLNNIIYNDIRTADYYDRIYLTSSCLRTNLSEFAVNQGHHIIKICNQFYDIGKSFIDDCTRYPLRLQQPIEHCEQGQKKELLKSIHQIISVYVKNNFNTKLGKSESYTLAFLSVGLSTDDISLLLEVTKRTVEQKLQILRKKLSCNTSFQLAFLIVNSPIASFIRRLIIKYAELLEAGSARDLILNTIVIPEQYR